MGRAHYRRDSPLNSNFGPVVTQERAVFFYEKKCFSSIDIQFYDDTQNRWNPRKEVDEMDVRVTAHTFNPAAQAEAEYAIVRQTAGSVDTRELTGLNENIVREVHEKVLMDLRDVQHFLYMLIGSEIKVESGNDRIGMKLNTVV
jgi:hypothetical protein